MGRRDITRKYYFHVFLGAVGVEYVICSLHKVLWFHHKMLEERLQSLNSALHQASYSSPKSYCIIKARAGFERSHSSAKSG